jgi:hypothetical protein
MSQSDLQDMTMRDFIAFLAMQSAFHRIGLYQSNYQELAKASYDIADAMLSERQQREEKL